MLIRKRAARTDDDDDDTPPVSSGDGELAAAIALIRKRATRVDDDDDDVSPVSGGDGALNAGIALIRKRAALPDDDNDISPTSGGDDELVAAIAFIRKRAALVDDDDDDVQPTSGGCGEVMAAPVRRRYGNKSVPVDANDSINNSMDALFQVHLHRVRNSAAPGMGTAAQRAEAKACVARQRVEEEARLQQAQAKVEALQERLKAAELKLALCEADERALDGMLSESSQQKSTWQKSTRQSTRQSTQPAVHSADRVAEALRRERLLRARQHLGTEQARRQTALAVAKVRMEAAATQLIEMEAETVAATQAEKEAADASANAWAQVHLAAASQAQVHMARVRKSKARRHAEVDALAARKSEVDVEVLTRQARAKLDAAKERLVQSEVELALCEADEKALDELLTESTESLVRRPSESTESEPVAPEQQKLAAPPEGDENDASPTSCGDGKLLVMTAPGHGDRSTSVAADQVDEESFDAADILAAYRERGRKVNSNNEATEASSGEVRSASRLQAGGSERLTRARENARGRLGAERARREAVEAALAQNGRSRSRASVLGWSPPRPLALSSPSEIISGLGSRQWRWNAPMNSRSAGSLLTGSPGPPSLPPSVVSNDCEISSTSEAQTASPTAQLPRGYMSPRPPPRRVSPSLMRAMRSHRREVAVVPAFVSCKQKPADRQGSGRLSRTLPAAQRRSTTPASALAAQQWLSSTMQTLPLSSRLSTAEGGEGDANLTIQVARI